MTYYPPDVSFSSGNPVPSSAFEHTVEIAGRIKAVIDSVGGLARASEIAGVSNDALAKWRDGKARPAFYALATLARAAGRTADWVLLGDSAGGGVAHADAITSLEANDFTLVPRLGVEASAGHGLVALAEEVTERLAFKTDWLRDMGLSPQYVGLLTCRGDSQDPVIKDGALMLVDMRPDQQVRSGNFYVIVLDGDVLVKRLNRRIDGSIELLSHNPAYPTETIDSQQLDKLTIPGRVVWAGQKL
jgi:phage repressor protein C with HTH and peptisase S24 domain